MAATLREAAQPLATELLPLAEIEAELRDEARPIRSSAVPRPVGGASAIARRSQRAGTGLHANSICSNLSTLDERLGEIP